MKTKIAIIILAIAALAFSACSSGNKKAANDAIKTEKTQTVAEGKYYCPMHPEGVSDTAGVCPKCGMQLEKKESGKKDSLKK